MGHVQTNTSILTPNGEIPLSGSKRKVLPLLAVRLMALEKYSDVGKCSLDVEQ